MPRKIDLGRALLALGAALLIASLFVDWYDDGLTAWDAFEVLDLVLLCLAVAALVAAVRPDLLGMDRGSAAVGAIPAAALLIVAVQLINPPPAAAAATPSTGAWMALGAAVVMLAGVALAVSRIAVTMEVGDPRLRRRAAAVDRRGGDAMAATDDAPTAVADPPAGDGSVERTQPLRILSDDDDEPERP
ncbi:MAG TPA: hypothetical protein VFT50_18775 [Baekduia sp.]|nr:hypothetical protein [Baekduia sp.]